MATDQPPPRTPIRAQSGDPIVVDRQHVYSPRPPLRLARVGVWLGDDARDLQAWEGAEDRADDRADDPPPPTLMLDDDAADRLVAQLLRGPMGPPGPMGPMGFSR